jgi:hypothetical protein
LWLDPLDGYSPRAEGLGGFFERLAPLADPFGSVRLALDDFDYVSESRTGSALANHLLLPHNTHLVPLFRLWTYTWLQVAGALARTPEVLGLAAYLSYAAAMMLLGHLVARETGRLEWGLAAMAVFGLSALLEPTISWYSASQAVLAGAGILAMLVTLQLWRARGGWASMALSMLAAVAAPLLWSGGYVAGPAGFAYLWADGRPHARKTALLPLIASIATAVAAFVLAGNQITAAANFHDRPVSGAVNLLQGLASTAQGVVEILILRNLGLEAATTPLQALALALVLAAVWVWTRGRPIRPNSLEAAGAVTALAGFLLVYMARGYFTFDSLRDLSWYQAIPQIGAVLFGAGWWAGHPIGPLPRSLAAPTRVGLFGVLALMTLLVVLQTPRVRAQRVAAAPRLAAAERTRFPTPVLQRLRARYLQAERVAWQRRFLTRLDRAEELARKNGWGRDEIRTEVGRMVEPKPPGDMPHIDAVDLLVLPKIGAQPDLGQVAQTLRPVLSREPEPRPAWLEPNEPWPPKT